MVEFLKQSRFGSYHHFAQTTLRSCLSSFRDTSNENSYAFKQLTSSATRHTCPIDESFRQKFFDPEHLAMITLHPSDGRLVLDNNHMSAYDKGGASATNAALRQNIASEER